MRHYNIDQFIELWKQGKLSAWTRNLHLKQPGFKLFYVRIGSRVINHKMMENVLALANIEADKYGQGTFKKLIAHLRQTYPDLNLYVENVLQQQFVDGLLRIGFQQETQTTNSVPCFLMEATPNDSDISLRV